MNQIVDILLGKNTSNRGVNVTNGLTIDISNDTSALPLDPISTIVDSYEQYYAERNESRKYRFNFTISPICTNVLFNNVSEIVYKEGDDGSDGEQVIFGREGFSVNDPKIPESIKEYTITYKGDSSAILNRDYMIRDTAYSHPACGGVVYHCGFDIFNNHTLRRKEFHIVNKLDTSNTVFNTLSDLCRDYRGTNITNTKSIVTIQDDQHKLSAITFDEHAYMYDTVEKFYDSIERNLVEKDGWFGFLNPCTIEIANYGDNVINKCMNNNKVGEFIDMYPDRSLFSFIPKYNKYKNRKESNWEAYLTYPYKNYYDNPLVQDVFDNSSKAVWLNGNEITEEEWARIGGKLVINGLKGKVITNLFPENGFDESDYIFISTDVSHNFDNGDEIYLSIINETENSYEIYNIDSPMAITGVGLSGEDTAHYFSINYDSIGNIIEYYFENRNDVKNIYFRVAKRVEGERCKYYFRIFKKIPNFNDSNIYNKRYLTEDEINVHSRIDFDHSITKMAFERTIYNDNKVQIMFNEDVETNCLRDNLGRELSQVYLTILKCNKGYRYWYYGGLKEDVEFSHCFGKLTAGLDLPDNVKDYNVHKIHNIPYSFNLPLVRESVKNLENGDYEIGNEGDDSLSTVYGNGAFYGDIVEFDIINLNEVTLEDVYFRFNTAQREYCSEETYTSDTEYGDIHYDEIVSDDYDISDSFTVTTKTYNQITYLNKDGSIEKIENYFVNLNPEGYYYKAHYPVQIKKLSENANIGYHIRLTYEVIDANETYVEIKTDKNYYIQSGDAVYLYRKDDTHAVITGRVSTVLGHDFTDIIITTSEEFDDINKYVIYRKNPLKPDYAYEFNDGTGRYVWRDLDSDININADDELFNSMFTNGAYYIHKNINFFLKRQDPDGKYGLLYDSGSPSKVKKFINRGRRNPISNKVYISTDDKSEVC